MSSGRNINLMPEDLRSKEEDIKSGKSSGLHIDLVVPDWQKDKKSTITTDVSFWQKIKNIFKKQPHFGEPIKTEHHHKEKKEPKEKSFDFDFKEPKHEKSRTEIEEVHLPKQEAKPEFKEVKFKEAGIDFSLPSDGEKKKPVKGPSFWDKLKNIFSVKKSKKISKPKEFKKISDSILLKGTNGNGNHSKPEPLVLPKKDFVLEQTVAKVEPIPAQPVLNKLAEKVEADFSIPELTIQSSPRSELRKELSEANEEISQAKPKKEESKFHQPTPMGKSRFTNGGAEVDLIPAAARTRSWRQISVLMAVSIFGSLATIVVFYGVLFFQEKNIQNQQDRKAQQISDLERQILTYEDLNKEISELGKEIRTVDDVLNRHIYWTNFFSMLEKYTPAEIYYQGLSAGNNGALTLNAVGSDYQSPARLLKLLEQPEAKEFVSMVSISSAGTNESGVGFDVTFVLNENLFYYGNGPKDQQINYEEQE